MIAEHHAFNELVKDARRACYITIAVAVVVCVWPRTWPLLTAALFNYAGAIFSCFLYVFSHDECNNNNPPQ